MGQRVRLYEKLGAGGTAEVFRAEIIGDGGFTKPVAVKRLLPRFVEERHLLDMFIDEARILSKLTHPNIVQVFNFQRCAGQYLLLMEYVPGTSLARLLSLVRNSGADLPLSVVAHIGAEAATGLDYAHRREDEDGRPLHIIHRDISPDNILLSADGEVKVVDFGIAKAVHRTTETAYGRIKGKTFYMAPERLRHGEVDARVDIFSLGLVLHEMLTKKRLFERPSEPEVFFAIMEFEGLGEAERPTGVPAPLWRVVTRAMAPQPSDRYARAADMADDLERFRNTIATGAGASELLALLKPLEDSLRAPGAVDGDEHEIEEEEISGMVTHPNLRRSAGEAPAAEDPGGAQQGEGDLSGEGDAAGSWAPDPFDAQTRNERPNPLGPTGATPADEIETHYDQHLPFLPAELDEETSQEHPACEYELDDEITDMDVPDLDRAAMSDGDTRPSEISRASTVSYRVEGKRRQSLILLLVISLFLASFGLVWLLLRWLDKGPGG